MTISGMTITRGESNADPQFHVMVSSIQAVRYGVDVGTWGPTIFAGKTQGQQGEKGDMTLERAEDGS